MLKREKRKAKDEKKEERKASGEAFGAPIEMMDPADLGLPGLDSIRSEEHQVPADIQAALELANETADG
ncbi:MAG: hypothetical protein O3A53_06105 [Acidobacteria bacterium]|nr:hypothetical protein [Acidobacteriota bacterium]